jgi:hypothetical protein
VFVLLIVILGATAYLSLRTNMPSSASTSPVTTPGDLKNNLVKDGGDARIRMDLMKEGGEGDDVGRTNLFEYRLGQLSRTGPGGKSQQAANEPPVTVPPPITQTPFQPPAPTGPPPPPPTPPMPQFKYDGFVRTPKGLNASVSDPANNHFYNLKEDDILLGRYRIARITDTVVEVEDLEIPRRQAFSRAQ